MDESGRHKHRLAKLFLGIALGLGILVALLVGTRARWIRPVPGVSLAMRLPPVTEADLGPDSAYRLLLEATKPPPIEVAQYRAIWGRGFSHGKLLVHPWPAEPPPTMAEWVTDLELQDAIRLAAEKAGDAPVPLATLPDPPEKRILAEDAPWTREQYDDVLRTVELYEPNIRLLDQALAAPNPQMLTVQTTEQMLGYLQWVRALARHMAVAAAVKVGAGDAAGGFGLLVKSARMGNLVCRGAGAINHLIGGTCAATATHAATLLAHRHDIPPEALVPDYLPYVPVDVFSGKPFLYLPSAVPGLPDGTWAIYSVGTDGRDDGGMATSCGAITRGKQVNLDSVWPSQPYPKPPTPDTGL